MKKTLYLMALLILTSCGAGTGDIDIDLGQGYIFNEMGGTSKAISYEGKGFVVPTTVVGYKNSLKYLMVIRQPFLPPPTDEYGHTLGKAMLQKKCEYWIINKDTQEVLGPLSKGEFYDGPKVKYFLREVNVDADTLKIPFFFGEFSYCFN